MGGGMDHLVDRRIQLSPRTSGILHRFVDHAAEDQP